VYCGKTADTRDHFVPRAYRSMVADWRKQEGWERVPDTVPACRECNCTAGANVFRTIAEKRRYVQGEYRRKYARLLASPFWTRAELDDLGPGLRSTVEREQTHKARLLLRLAWPYRLDHELEALAFELARQGDDEPDLTPALDARRRREILR
jgi:hypothetical protein